MDTETWLPLAEAAERLATTVDALRKRVRREQIRARRGNDGRVYVQVDGQPAASQALDTGQPEASQGADAAQPEASREVDSGQSVASLLVQLDEARELTERWRAKAEEARIEAAGLRAEVETARQQVETEIAARNAVIETLREDLAHERARTVQLATEIAEARKPMLVRMIEALRRR